MTRHLAWLMVLLLGGAALGRAAGQPGVRAARLARSISCGTCRPRWRRCSMASEVRLIEFFGPETTVSHELRTPVAALKALVETLEEGAMEDPLEGPAFLHRMHVEVDGLPQLNRVFEREPASAWRST